MRKFRALGVWLGLLLACGAAGGVAADAEKDVTAEIEKLGNPFTPVYPNPYARNVWSMKAFDGKLFAGAGNFDNGGPGAYPQVTAIFALDPATKKFALEYRAPDDQLWQFRVIDNVLYVPGCDPIEDWSLGNYYTRAAGSTQWEKHRNLPNQLHTFDICARDGKLFTTGHGILESSDGGKTFTLIPVTQAPTCRCYAFLTFPNNVYAVGDSFANGEGIFVMYDHKAKTFYQPGGVSQKTIMPDTKLEGKLAGAHMQRSWSFKDKVLYIMGTKREYVGGYCAVDGKHKGLLAFKDFAKIAPKARFAARKNFKAGLKVTRVKHPAGTLPAAFATTAAKAYFCYAEKISDEAPGGKWKNHVLESTTGLAWKPLFVFDCPTFVRSMEVLDGFLYFGLGSEFKDYGKSGDNKTEYQWSPDELSPAAGEIWRVKLPE